MFADCFDEADDISLMFTDDSNEVDRRCLLVVLMKQMN